MARRKRATPEELERARPDPARPDRDTLIRRITLPDREPRLKSPVARAVVPVLGGIGVLVAIALFTWGIAAWLSGSDTEPSDRLAPQRLELGSVQSRADDVAEDGPILITELSTVDGDRSLVIDHEGDDPTVGWRVYYAFPVGRPDCPVTQVIGTRTFIDCDGDELDVTELSPPLESVRPVVENERILYLDLRAFSSLGET